MIIEPEIKTQFAHTVLQNSQSVKLKLDLLVFPKKYYVVLGQLLRFDSNREMMLVAVHFAIQ